MPVLRRARLSGGKRLLMRHPVSGKLVSGCGDEEPASGDPCDCCGGDSPLRFTVQFAGITRCVGRTACEQDYVDYLNTTPVVLTQDPFDPCTWLVAIDGLFPANCGVTPLRDSLRIALACAAGAPDVWTLGARVLQITWDIYNDLSFSMTCAGGASVSDLVIGDCGGVSGSAFGGTAIIVAGP